MNELSQNPQLHKHIVMPSSCLFCGIRRKIVKETIHFYFFEPIEGVPYDYAAKQLCSRIQ